MPSLLTGGLAQPEKKPFHPTAATLAQRRGSPLSSLPARPAGGCPQLPREPPELRGEGGASSRTPIPRADRTLRLLGAVRSAEPPTLPAGSPLEGLSAPAVLPPLAQMRPPARRVSATGSRRAGLIRKSPRGPGHACGYPALPQAVYPSPKLSREKFYPRENILPEGGDLKEGKEAPGPLLLKACGKAYGQDADHCARRGRSVPEKDASGPQRPRRNSVRTRRAAPAPSSAGTERGGGSPGPNPSVAKARPRSLS